jgi:hypothetical protein
MNDNRCWAIREIIEDDHTSLMSILQRYKVENVMHTKILNRSTMHKGTDGRDITIRAGLPVSPTWRMIKEYKAGTLSKAQYTTKYIDILEANKQAVYDWITSLPERLVVFLCFCPEGEFCHTHLLIEWLIEKWPDEFQDGRLHNPTEQAAKRIEEIACQNKESIQTEP